MGRSRGDRRGIAGAGTQHEARFSDALVRRSRHQLSKRWGQPGAAWAGVALPLGANLKLLASERGPSADGRDLSCRLGNTPERVAKRFLACHRQGIAAVILGSGPIDWSSAFASGCHEASLDERTATGNFTLEVSFQ